MAIINAFGVLGITSITTPTDNLRVFSSSSSPATILDSSGAFLSLPPGTLIFHCGLNAPAGFLKANGATISRTVYSALFATLGTTFGVGDGSTTFSVPDMRGEFPRGWADDRSVDTGRAFGSFQADDFKSHAHTYNQNTNQNTDHSGFDTISNNPSFSSQNTGFAGGTETRPRNIALLACIKY